MTDPEAEPLRLSTDGEYVCAGCALCDPEEAAREEAAWAEMTDGGLA